MFKKFIILISALLSLGNANKEEKELSNYLFENYVKTTRPIKKYEEPVIVEMGLGVQTLESFNQKEESLALNIWVRSNWNDNNLAWGNYSNLTFLSVNTDDIWIPDIELLNAASKPVIYTLKGGVNLYDTGDLMYSKPGIYKYACSLNLKKFPFDTQNCTMIFGNWVYSNKYVFLKPYDEEDKQVDILSSFSHSEWRIDKVEVTTRNETRDCCPDEEYHTLYYSFLLKRFPHYYKISMGMTITLVVVSFIITLMSADNVSRTGTAVFIPLTILALQLTIADKIPIVGYFTLMDQFFLCCFITSMLCSIESGLVFALITTKSPWFFRFIDKLGFCKTELEVNNENNGEEEFEDVINKLKKTQSDIELNNNQENIKMETIVRSKSYNEVIGLRQRTISPKIELEEMKTKDLNENKFVGGDVYKVINFDDKRLNLTEREREIDDKIFNFVIYLDNTIRILLPIIFFSYIIYIFSFEN